MPDARPPALDAHARRFARSLRVRLELTAAGADDALFEAHGDELHAEARSLIAACEARGVPPDPRAVAFLDAVRDAARGTCDPARAPASVAAALLAAPREVASTVRALRVLFVCSRNRWRSPTAERMFRRRPGLDVRSAGTAASARRRVRAEDLRWADLVLVMETEHARQLRRAFPGVASDVRIESLDVPDAYEAMDPRLMAILEDAVPPRIAAAREAS